jgi:hypothetical protein
MIGGWVDWQRLRKCCDNDHMATITRSEFTSEMRNKQVRLSDVEGMSAKQQRDLKRADVNGDGVIRGTREVDRMFTAIDNSDRNGTRNSIDTRKAPVARMMENTKQAAKPTRGMGGGDAGGASGADAADGTRPSGNSGSTGNHLRASVDKVRSPGARNQMTEGKITVNGRTYDYRSGGAGKGSLPNGTYNVTRHLDSRSDRTMQVGGVGWSFALNDKFDARVGATRTALRIHPDGAGAGTIGCMGIVGDAATQRQFRADMLAELRRNGGSMKLTVG